MNILTTLRPKKIKYLFLTIALLLPISPATLLAAEKLITKDPHRAKSGFFDIHICNWPDRPPFYLALFGTEQYEDISSIEISSPDNQPIGSLDLQRFTVTKKDDKTERHVFLSQLSIAENNSDGWYTATINFHNRPSQTAQDFIIHQTLSRATGFQPEADSEDIVSPRTLTWKAIDGATYYKVFIKDMWNGDVIIHSSNLLESNSFDVPEGLLQSGGYYAWRVHARDLNEHIQLGDFNIGSLSHWVEFSVAD